MTYKRFPGCLSYNVSKLLATQLHLTLVFKALAKKKTVIELDYSVRIGKNWFCSFFFGNNSTTFFFQIWFY